jgi:dTMP kinase
MANLKSARIIVLEGTEGVGKTTQAKKLVDFLRDSGYRVLQTKEPGIDLLPITMQLRGLMLDARYSDVMTLEAREYISQAIRSIHLEQLIAPSLEEFDFIVQDRGTLSGLSYGSACGMDEKSIMIMNDITKGRFTHKFKNTSMYDDVIYLRGDVESGLEAALSSKREFEAGDAMEAKGVTFLNKVQSNMDRFSKLYNTHIINVQGKSIETVFSEILVALNIRNLK